MAIKKRLFSHYQILLAISQNPHTEEPKKLWDILTAQFNDTINYKLDTSATVDKAGFEALKQAMAGNPRLIIK